MAKLTTTVYPVEPKWVARFDHSGALRASPTVSNEKGGVDLPTGTRVEALDVNDTPVSANRLGMSFATVLTAGEIEETTMLGPDQYNTERGFGSLFEARACLGGETYEDLDRNADRGTKTRAAAVEAAYGRWEAERRRMCIEIDALRRTVDELRGQSQGRQQLEDRFEERSRYARQLEVQCQETQQRLQSEELRMRSKIEDLESQIIELLDRSSNGHRAEQQLEQKMEIELAARRHVLEASSERRLKEAEAEWQAERDRLGGEVRQLKEELSGHPKRSQTSLLGKILSR